MSRASPYSIEFKLQVVREYEQGIVGYKKLARMYNLNRDTVRNWVNSPRLRKLGTAPQEDTAVRPTRDFPKSSES